MSRDQRAGGPLLGKATKTIGSFIGAGVEAYAHNKEKKRVAAEAQAQAQAPPQSQSQGSHQGGHPGGYQDYQGGHQGGHQGDHRGYQQSAQQSGSHQTAYGQNAHGPTNYDHHTYDEDHNGQDEEDWALDDASEDLHAQGQHRRLPIESAALAMPVSATRPMPCPVILPQRRPQTKSRGFVRAYAPLLNEYKGIDEATFLSFLDEFQEKTAGSSVLYAINIGAMMVGAVPSVVAMALSTVMTIGSNLAMEGQNRYKTNGYLADINKRLFNPRNLHCVIMTYRPDSKQKVVDVDLNATDEAIVKNMGKNYDSTTSKLTKSTAAGRSTSEFAIPAAAPLVYPELDKVAFAVSEDGQPIPPQKQGAFKRSGEFLKTYLDRRAQAEYVGSYGEDSKLAIPGSADPQKFASRWSDPNHPTNSGGVLALLTGGAFDPRAKVLDKRAGMTAKLRHQQLTEQDHKNIKMGRGGPASRPGLISTIRKHMKSDVLYMLIAEIPGREELIELQRLNGIN